MKEEEKPEIDIDYFAGLDLRVAKVVACEKVQKADKLLHLTVDVGGKREASSAALQSSIRPKKWSAKKWS